MYASPSPNQQQDHNTSQQQQQHQHNSSSQQHGGSLTLVRRLKLLASDVENQPIVCRRGVLPSLLLFLQSTDPEIRIIAAETLCLLSSHPDNPECLCRERGLVQVIVSTYRTSKENDPILYELCGTIIKNLGPAVTSNNNEGGNPLRSPLVGQQQQRRDGSTFTQLEFLSGSRQRGNNNGNDDDDDQQQPNQNDDDDEQHQYYQNQEGSPEASNDPNNANPHHQTRSPGFVNMTTTRRFNPRTRSSHFINGGMPPNSVCRNVQLKVHQLVPARRQHLVECLHTTRGVISYTIDLPTRNLTVFLSVPAENLVTTLSEDGFDEVEVLADVEVAMLNNAANTPGGENNNNQNDQDDDGQMLDTLNQFYLSSKNYNMNDQSECENYQQLSEYKKSLMVSTTKNNNSGKNTSVDDDASSYDKENNSLIARIQKRKEMEQKQSAWGNVWEVLRNVFW